MRKPEAAWTWTAPLNTNHEIQPGIWLAHAVDGALDTSVIDLPCRSHPRLATAIRQEMHPVKLDRKIGTKTYHTRLFSSIWIAGSLKHNDSWSSRRVPGKGLILMSCFGTKQQKIDLKRGRFFVVYLAVPTGFEPAISALTGPHVRPLHHGTNISAYAVRTSGREFTILNNECQYAQSLYSAGSVGVKPDGSCT